MGNIVEIEGYINDKIKAAKNQREKLLEEKGELEQKKEEILSLKKNRNAVDGFYDDQLDEIETELEMIDHEIKVENHTEWKNKEKIGQYKNHAKKVSETA